MTKNANKMQPWQIFHAARVQLGAVEVGKIFNRGARSAYDWAQDPATTVVRCRSPLELLHTLFERLELAGRGYVARAAISYLESALEDGIAVPAVEEPHESIDVELLRDFAAVAQLQEAVSLADDVDAVRILVAKAKAEIDRTFARYLQDLGKTER